MDGGFLSVIDGITEREELIMTKYVAEILKQLGIDYQKYDIRNHCDEESGETWITLHPKSEVCDNVNLKSKLDVLFEGAYGKYKIYWDENSCYLKIVGILEIFPNGEQVFPTPMVDKPAMFSKEYILELWKNNRDYVPELICNDDCELDDEPIIDANVGERYLPPCTNIEIKEVEVANSVDEDDEEGLSLKSKRFGKRKKS